MPPCEHEADIIERLNEANTVRGFFIATVEILEEAVDRLIQRIFRKDDFAVKSVVEPLLHDSGPLGELTVRLKLLYGLGVIAQPVYQDIERCLRIRDMLNRDGSEYSFTDPKIIKEIKALHQANVMGVAQLDMAPISEDIDLSFYQMQMARQEQVVKSTLALAISGIATELNKDSPF
ncbi:MltR family transcriptional regulator [Photobacterium sp. CCB-ST2H9]|uniref:MltR family transcriptional regulator n=1 Tax=Photobacterium sp. CCB-ST2H9 TaxID=2912855 RepID=UPI002002D7AA|nr:MltR family transcriptional regulator [Photobacterium sp. CCB-ST2H9]UTM57160.1 MltR family transcriptional regulator [Photobacterium sp. CCB-ST2H9]